MFFKDGLKEYIGIFEVYSFLFVTSNIYGKISNKNYFSQTPKNRIA